MAKKATITLRATSVLTGIICFAFFFGFVAAPVHAEDTLNTQEVEVLCNFIWDYPISDIADTSIYPLLFEVAGMCDTLFSLPAPYEHTTGWVYVGGTVTNSPAMITQRRAEYTGVLDTVFLGEYPYWFADEMIGSALTNREMLVLKQVYSDTESIRYNTFETSMVFYLDGVGDSMASIVAGSGADCENLLERCDAPTDWDKIIDGARYYGSDSIIFVHNHPPLSSNGDSRYHCLPSAPDFLATVEENGWDAYFARNGITLYDMVVVSADCLYSLNAHRQQPDGYRSVQWAWRDAGYTDSDIAHSTYRYIGYCWTHDYYDGYIFRGNDWQTGYEIYTDTEIDGNTITYGGRNSGAAPAGTRCDNIQYIRGG